MFAARHWNARHWGAPGGVVPGGGGGASFVPIIVQSIKWSFLLCLIKDLK